MLHDANGQFYSDSDLNDYINEARQRVVADTGCYRVLQSYTLTAGTELYVGSALPTTPAIDIVNLTIIWGSTRYPLVRMSFSAMSAQFRTWTSFQARPLAFATYNQSPLSFYISPIPDQAYVTEVDTVVLPATLAADADVDVIGFPYDTPVKFYAAYLAKDNSQEYDKAGGYLKTYGERVVQAIQGSFTAIGGAGA